MVVSCDCMCKWNVKGYSNKNYISISDDEMTSAGFIRYVKIMKKQKAREKKVPLVIDVIKRFIIGLFPKMEYDYCYSDMEYEGVAAFGLCHGCNDKACPYNTSIEEE